MGVIRWAIKLRQEDILLEVALLSTHLALLRIGHLQEVYHILAYLKESPIRRLFFDPKYSEISENKCQFFDRVYFYKGAREKYLLTYKKRGIILSVYIILLVQVIVQTR